MLYTSYDNRFMGFMGFGQFFGRNAFGYQKVEQ